MADVVVRRQDNDPRYYVSTVHYLDYGRFDTELEALNHVEFLKEKWKD
jgi:hypothetical protein